MKIRNDHATLIARSSFLEKLHGSLVRGVPGFGDLDQEARVDFVVDALYAAEANGLKAEQGVASYALAMWWLGPDFEAGSAYLQALLKSGFPEFRKIYAMNEWVHAKLAEPEHPFTADERLREAFYRTAAWGTASGAKS